MISSQKRDVQDWLDSMRGNDDADTGGGGGNQRWLPQNRAGATAAILALAVMAGFWIWAFSPLAPSSHPDVLEYAAYTVVAEERCARTMAEMDLLPGAAEATGPADRAEQIRESTTLLEGMLADLRDEAEVLIGQDAELVEDWLADWRTYLEDRRAYAETLAGGSDPPFTVTARDGEAITGFIDLFAEVNAMAGCATPTDV